MVHYDRLTIYRREGVAGRIEPVLARADSGEIIDPTPDSASFDDGLTSWVIGRGDAVCANDVGESALTSSSPQASTTRFVPGWTPSHLFRERTAASTGTYRPPRT